MANRAPFYRIVFTLAALYNLGFGLWAGLSPGSFFDLFDLRQPLYPQPFPHLRQPFFDEGLDLAEGRGSPVSEIEQRRGVFECESDRLGSADEAEVLECGR